MKKLMLSLAIGCGKLSACEAEQTEMIPIDKVPAAVMDKAKEELPGVTFDTAWKEQEGNVEFFEVRGKTKEGKTRDVKISSDGKNVVEKD